MNLKEPRRKTRGYKPNLEPPLPIITQPNGEIEVFHGRFNGFAVVVEDREEQERLYTMGFFGKGNLSKSFPAFAPKDSAPLVRERQFNNRMDLEERLEMTRFYAPEKVLVVRDSDTEEDFTRTMKAEYKLDHCNLREFLQLSMCEAYFLAKQLKCLEITNEGNLMDNENLWYMFGRLDYWFVQRYAVYHFFKSKNWIVKSGVKFGAEFLLYKEGPPFYHASYLVKIDVVDSETLERNEEQSCFPRFSVNCQGYNRLAGTTAKELLICQVLWPKDLTLKESIEEDCIERFSIRQLLVRRWKPLQKRSDII